MKASLVQGRQRTHDQVPPAVFADDFAPGEVVEIVAGPLAGLVATILRPASSPAMWLVQLRDGSPGVFLRLPSKLLRRRATSQHSS